MTRVITTSAWSNTRIKTGNNPGSFTPMFFIPMFFVTGAERLLCLLLAFVVSLVLLGCAPKPDEVLRIGLASAPVTLDPRFATDATSSRINRLLYTRLVEFNDQQLPIPGLATWELISPTHYRFRLKPDAESRTFPDGSRLTANDIQATYLSVLEKETGSPHRATLAMIEAIDVLDDDTLDFHLSRADRLFPAYLSIGILPAAKIKSRHPFNHQPFGSGPFVFTGWPEEGRLLLQRRRDGQRVGFVYVADATVRVLKLLRGEIDMLQNDLPPELITFLQQRDDVQVSKVRGSNFTYLGFNLMDPIVGDVRVRRAIAHAIDREAIIRYVMGGAARPASALLPPEHWAGNPQLNVLDYDPRMSRKILASLGYDHHIPLRLTYKTSTNAFRVRLATVLQSQLKAVGIDIDLRSYDWGTFYGDIKAGNFQMFSLSWVGVKSPDIFRYVFHSQSVPPNGANRGRFDNPAVDRLIEVADSAYTQDQQAQTYQQLQVLLLNELPYVPLWYEDHVFVAKKTITGYRLGLDGNYDGLIAVHRDAF